MYRVWYSTESFADFLIENTNLHSDPDIQKVRLFESDASKPNDFYKMPDHIRKILYLDAPDIIVEKNQEPIFSLEYSTEAGTGHNSFQRFARIAAAAENSVPAFYIYPEGVIIERKRGPLKWDCINPLIYKALEHIMRIYDVPALLYYFPNEREAYPNAQTAPHAVNGGLLYHPSITKFPGCPDPAHKEMKEFFKGVNELLDEIDKCGDVKKGRRRALNRPHISARRDFMLQEFSTRSNGADWKTMSPMSATVKCPTEYLLNYLKQYEKNGYQIGELLRSRKETLIYKADAKFRGDPYAGALTAIDYLACRKGETFEDRNLNLVLLFGDVELDDVNRTIHITGKSNRTIRTLVKDVKNCNKNNLLKKDYKDLKVNQIPRYYMQMRYGSTYSKVKHIRVFSYFADAILFPDGSLWRDA